MLATNEELQQDREATETADGADLSFLNNAANETPEDADDAGEAAYHHGLEGLAESADPVAMYFREMGRTPLLTREGEVSLAKRIERGQSRTLKALSRSPIVWAELVHAAETLHRHERSIEEIVDVGDEPLTPAQRERRTRKFLRVTGQIACLEKLASQNSRHLLRIPKSNTSGLLRGQYRLARTWVEISRLVRAIKLSPAEKARLTEKVREVLEKILAPECETLGPQRRSKFASAQNLREAHNSLGRAPREIERD